MSECARAYIGLCGKAGKCIPKDGLQRHDFGRVVSPKNTFLHPF